jgi:hypothetical protein
MLESDQSDDQKKKGRAGGNFVHQVRHSAHQ